MKEKYELDVKDKKLLTCILNNSRIPATQIAKQVALSRDAIAYRINRLEKRGIVRQYYPRINYKTLGLYTYKLFFLLDGHERDTIQELLAYLKEHPQTVQIVEYSDQWDYEVTIYAKNVDEVNDLLDDVRNKFTAAITESKFHVVIRHYVHRELPQNLLPSDYQPYDKEHDVKSLDTLDKEILWELTKDSRATTYAIGNEVGLSSDAVIYRMKKFTEQKIVRRYTANIDFRKLGLSQYTFGIQFRKFGNKAKARFEEFVREHPHIVQTLKTFGDIDMLVYIAVENHDDFHKTLNEIKEAFSQYIIRYDVYVMYKEHYYNPFPKICRDL